MFFQERLIIGYVYDPENDHYLFQLTEGKEYTVTREVFMTHWEEYRKFEEERIRASQQHAERYRPLPVTLVVHRGVKCFPVNPTLRRKRRSA